MKSKNTKPELLVNKHHNSLGFRFRLHVKKLLGTQYIAL
ncbi:MAG: hypothetical protein EOO47_20765 [Flavobacterium sp.]|nr:MAG: hypothetical protein EOO47_20765 [Flavobacterium sp.]